MALRYSTALRNAQLAAVTTAVGSGARLRIYSGAQPASVATAPSGTLLAELTCATPFAPAASAGVLTAGAITAATAAATGTAGWFRLSTAGGTAVLDGTVGTAGADLVLSSTSIVAGGTVSVTSLTVTAGNA